MVGRKADKNAVLVTRLRLLQKASHCKNKTAFFLLYCASYISHNLKRKDSMVRWHLCFSSLPSPSEGLKESGLFRRGGRSLPAPDDPIPAPQLKTRQFTYKIRGICGRSGKAGSFPSLKHELNILKKTSILAFVKTFNSGSQHTNSLLVFLWNVKPFGQSRHIPFIWGKFLGLKVRLGGRDSRTDRLWEEPDPRPQSDCG